MQYILKTMKTRWRGRQNENLEKHIIFQLGFEWFFMFFVFATPLLVFHLFSEIDENPLRKSSVFSWSPAPKLMENR